MHQLKFLRTPAVLILSLCFIAQASVFYGFNRGSEAVPPTKPFAQFPAQVNSWRMVQESLIDPDTRTFLRADAYLNRVYATPKADVASVFVAYFQSQKAGQTPHSPKNCLPGAGWIWTVSDRVPVSIANRPDPIEVNRYIVSQGDSRAVVLYWYQSRDRVIASEYKAAAYSVVDALKYNHTDTALVRVIVQFRNPNEQEAAYQTAVGFVQSIFSPLRTFFPA